MDNSKEYHGKVYDLIQKGDLMIYNYRPGKIVDYLTANDILFQVLSTYGVSPFVWDGRIRFQLQANDEHSTYRIHDLAYAAYNGHIKSVETWRADMQAFLDWKRFNGLTMDHADGNGHNNTAANISLMPASLNTSKLDIASRFQPPVYMASAYVDGDYRIGITWDTVKTNAGAGSATLYLLCDSAEAYVDCLRALSRVDPEWYQPLPPGNGWRKSDNVSAFSDVGLSIAAQDELSKMDRGSFNRYTPGGLKEYLRISSVEQLIVCERA